MKICIPVGQADGLRSEIVANFRAAPALLVVDSESSECLAIDASSGACHATPPHIDAVVCAGGIGRGLFNGLRGRGIRVFKTDAVIVQDALAELAAGRLVEVAEVECCGGGHHGQHDAHGSGDDGACGCHGGAGDGTKESSCGCSRH